MVSVTKEFKIFKAPEYLVLRYLCLLLAEEMWAGTHQVGEEGSHLLWMSQCLLLTAAPAKEPNAHMIQQQCHWTSPMLQKLNFTSEGFELIAAIPAVVQSLGLLD